MKATPLGGSSGARIRRILEDAGWDAGRAESAALGLEPGAVHATGLDSETLQFLVSYAGGSLGLEILTGDDWAIISGSMARLSSLARPWGGPTQLAELAHTVGLALPAIPPQVWLTAHQPLTLGRPLVAGILNVTPDSFSDGGRYLDPGPAAEQAGRLIDAGANIIDVGGESTRPGAPGPVSAEKELARVLPVIEALHAAHPAIPLSIDTWKAAVAERCLAAGASIVNDVSGGRLDPELPAVVAGAGAGLVLMHSRGDVSDMAGSAHAVYHDLVAEVVEELGACLARATAAGVAAERIVIDPGFGFAKRARHNWLLLDQLAALGCVGRPILVGPSRKRFLGAATGRPVAERDVSTAVACALAWERGAVIFRVHDVAPVRDALAVAGATGRTPVVSPAGT